jgi:phosphate/phosphite/phosphonate ABC transporter binding protein
MHNALETAADELTLIKGRRMLVHCLRALELPEPITFAGDSPGALDARDPSQRDSVGPSSSDDPAASAQLSSHTTSSRRGLVGAALLAVFFLGFAGFMSWKNQRSMEPLRIGMAPHLPAKVLLRDFEPLRKYLQEQMNRPIELVVTKTYGELIEQLALGNVDVAELSGYPYLLLRQRDPNAWPLVAVLSNQASSYESYIVVRRAADKGASSRRIGWAHLRGKRICYVDRTSTSGYLMPRAMLRRAGFAPDRHFSSIRFSGNHYNALRDLINDRCDVAAVNNEAYLSAARHGIRSSSVRVIAISPPLPYGVYCASSKLAKRVGRRLKKALLALDMKRDIGRSRLSPTVPVSGFAPFDLREFNQLAREARLPR